MMKTDSDATKLYLCTLLQLAYTIVQSRVDCLEDSSEYWSESLVDAKVCSHATNCRLDGASVKCFSFWVYTHSV